MKKYCSTLCRGLVCLCFAAALCAAPVFAAADAPDMSRIYDRLLPVFDLEEQDMENYDKNYAASLPVEFSVSKQMHYLALGGAAASGLIGVKQSDSYPALLAAHWGLSADNYVNLGDYDSQNEEDFLVSSRTLMEYLRLNAAEIKKADLITFQVDASTFISESLEDVLNGKKVNWTKYISDEDLLKEVRAFSDQMVRDYSKQYGEKNVKRISIVLEHLLYQCVAYNFEMLDAIREIRKQNSDAVILVLGLYNPMQNLTFTSGDTQLDVSDLVDEMIAFSNVHLLTKTMEMEQVGFVDASAVEATGFGNVTIDPSNEAATTTELGKIVYADNKQLANKNGHRQLYDLVLGALAEPCKHKNTTLTNAKQPTCTENGYSGDTLCTDCNRVIKTGSKLDKAHTFGEWVVSKAPTCQKEGSGTHTCTLCGHTESGKIPKTEHTWDAGTVTLQPGCETTGTKTYACTVSGCNGSKTEELPATGHTADNYTSNGDATCQQDGTESAVCTLCGKTDTRTEEGSKLPHDFANGTCIYCGAKESKGPNLVVILAIVGAVLGGGIGGAVYFLKKKRQ